MYSANSVCGILQSQQLEKVSAQLEILHWETANGRQMGGGEEEYYHPDAAAPFLILA